MIGSIGAESRYSTGYNNTPLIPDTAQLPPHPVVPFLRNSLPETEIGRAHV